MTSAFTGGYGRVEVSDQYIGPHAQITTYGAEVFKRLDSSGYSDFKTENPEYTIKMLIERIEPPSLKRSMQYFVNIEPGLEQHVRKFIQRGKEDARACQASGQQV